MPKVFFSHDEIQQRPNSRYPAPDPFQIHYHFRPARPANLCITLDWQTGEVNASAGTFGPLTWVPYTMCLHINRNDSPHTYANLKNGSECVVALPGRDIVDETWYTALPLPRGVSELAVAGLHPFASRWVKPPSVQECAVNFECAVEFFKDYHSHGIVFVRVLGASIDEEILPLDREQVIHRYPTYEIDDKANRFGGSIERLGVMGEIFECPSFPAGLKSGWGNSFATWIRELCEERHIDVQTRDAILHKHAEYLRLIDDTASQDRRELQRYLTTVCRLIVNQDWEELGRIAR